MVQLNVGVLRFLNVRLRRSFGVVALVSCACMSLQGSTANSKSLPLGIVKALAGDEKAYCDQLSWDFKKGCKQSFLQNLLWRELEMSPRGRTATLVENHNMGACGSAGCSLYLFV